MQVREQLCPEVSREDDLLWEQKLEEGIIKFNLAGFIKNFIEKLKTQYALLGSNIPPALQEKFMSMPLCSFIPYTVRLIGVWTVMHLPLYTTTVIMKLSN